MSKVTTTKKSILRAGCDLLSEKKKAEGTCSKSLWVCAFASVYRWSLETRMLKEGVGCWGRSEWGLLVKNKSKVIINKYLPSARTVPCLAQYCQRQAQSHLGRPKEKITCPPSTPLYGFGDQVTKGPRAQFLTLGLLPLQEDILTPILVSFSLTL